jgi:hypothetical protein
MKKILSLALTLGAAVAIHAQGTFFPATYASDPNGTYSAGVVEDLTVSGNGPTGHGLAFGSQYQAQYYIGPANTVLASSLSAVGPATGFLGSSASDKAGGAGFFEGNGNAFITTGFGGGAVVTLQLRAWKGTAGSTFGAATISGASALYQFTLGGAGAPAGPPTSWSQNLGGGNFNPTIANFGLNTATSPEPATIALGLMGASALFIRRRKV